MVRCFGRAKGTEQWYPITLALLPFSCTAGLMQWFIELAEKKHPNMEYKTE